MTDKHPFSAWIKGQASTLAKLRIKDVKETKDKEGFKVKEDPLRAAWTDFIKPAPNPTLLSGSEDFSLVGCKALFWDPVALWGEAAKEACTACVQCGETKGQRDGQGKIRKVCGLTDTYFVVAPEYRHKACPGEKHCSHSLI